MRRRMPRRASRRVRVKLGFSQKREARVVVDGCGRERFSIISVYHARAIVVDQSTVEARKENTQQHLKKQ